MGKPSSHQLSKKSEHSLHSSSTHQKIQTPMSSHKMETIKRKKHKKTKTKIKTLFMKLKKQSEDSHDKSQDTTVTSLDSSGQNNTVININITDIPLPPPLGSKRKNSSILNDSTKRRKTDDSLIVITDDDVDPCPLASPQRQPSHIHCSTPLNGKDNQTLQNIMLNNFSNSNNNDSLQNFNEEVINLTKEIHKESYFTIDLTNDSDLIKTHETVIDVDKSLDHSTQTADCTIVSITNGSLSMSGDSDVTVLRNTQPSKKDNQIDMFARGISKLNSSEKGKLLELIAQNIFSGCNIPSNVKTSLDYVPLPPATETAQDSFIREVILGESKSRNSIGSNIYHPSKDVKNNRGLRMIVIDGSNVAMEHTKGATFSVKGLKICIDYFVKRGHVVKAFVPRFRCKYGKSSDPKLLSILERQGLVVFTPSREIQGRICVPYDDRYIVQCAAEFDGVIVSGDNYRDLLQENPRWRFVIENRLLPFTWVNDMIMFPKDPLGRNGPTLEEFLKHPENNGTTTALKK